VVVALVLVSVDGGEVSDSLVKHVPLAQDAIVIRRPNGRAPVREGGLQAPQGRPLPAGRDSPRPRRSHRRRERLPGGHRVGARRAARPGLAPAGPGRNRGGCRCNPPRRHRDHRPAETGEGKRTGRSSTSNSATPTRHSSRHSVRQCSTPPDCGQESE
jgi:hypothetical protein